MEKAYGVIILVLALFATTMFLAYNHEDEKIICIENKVCLNVEIASTPEARAHGLSNRDSIEEDEGMFFVFPASDFYGFWMKDMNFPLDLIWVDGDERIVGIEKNLQPCTETCEAVYPPKEVRYVLEINAGVADRFDLEIEDKFL